MTLLKKMLDMVKGTKYPKDMTHLRKLLDDLKAANAAQEQALADWAWSNLAQVREEIRSEEVGSLPSCEACGWVLTTLGNLDHHYWWECERCDRIWYADTSGTWQEWRF